MKNNLAKRVLFLKSYINSYDYVRLRYLENGKMLKLPCYLSPVTMIEPLYYNRFINLPELEYFFPKTLLYYQGQMGGDNSYVPDNY